MTAYGPPLLFNSRLPLASTANVGLPDPPRALRLAYNRCWVSGIKSHDPRIWILAGHTVQRIVSISGKDKDGRSLAAAKLINTVDPTGRPLALASLSAMPDGEPWFEIDGLNFPSAISIIQDVIARFGESPSNYQIYGSSSPELAGVIEDPTRDLQSTLDEIAANAGLRVSLAHPGYAPIRSAPAQPRRYTIKKLFNPKAVSKASGALTNKVVARYNARPNPTAPRSITGLPKVTGSRGGGSVLVPAVFGAGDPVAFESPPAQLAGRIVASVPSSIVRFGEIETSIELRWVTEARSASAALVAALTASSRPQWDLTAETDLDLVVFPGDVVDISHPHVPDVGPWLVKDAAPDESGHRTRLEMVAWSGPAPRIAIGSAQVDPAPAVEPPPGFEDVDRDPDPVDSEREIEEEDPQSTRPPGIPVDAVDGGLLVWDAQTNQWRSTGIVVNRDGQMYGQGVRVIEMTHSFTLNYQLVADPGAPWSSCIIECKFATAGTVTVAADLMKKVGFICGIVQTGPGQVTIAAEQGVSILSSGDRFKTQQLGSALTLYQRRQGAPLFHLGGETVA